MKRSRIPSHTRRADRPSPSERKWRSRFTVGMTGLLLLCLLAASPAWAAAPAGQTQPPQGSLTAPAPSVAPGPITPYVAAGYTIVGPIYVSSASSGNIVLYTGHSDVGIDLTGKQVIVVDATYKRLTIGDVKKGTKVYVCRKDNNVVVMVLAETAAAGGAKK